jgi:hypothetical protein
VILVLGLLVGAGAPALAQIIAPWIGEMIAVLLFLNAVRVGHRAAFGVGRVLQRGVLLMLGLQLAMPLAALALFWSLSLQSAPLALAVVLMLAAPSLTGAPNFVAMTGHDPAPAMRLLVLGTACFPVTACGVLLLLPGIAAGQAILMTVWLAGVILCVVSLGFLARALLATRFAPARVSGAVDGASALLLGVLVVGLMSEVGPLLRSDPVRLMSWVAAVLALNIGLQVGVLMLLRRLQMQEAVAASVVAGNRNIALFLMALPEEIMAPTLLFIGCYQIPMYLTPLLLKRLHGASARNAA